MNLKQLLALWLVLLVAGTTGCAASPSAAFAEIAQAASAAPTFTVALDPATPSSTTTTAPLPATAISLPSHTPSLTPSMTPSLTPSVTPSATPWRTATLWPPNSSFTATLLALNGNTLSLQLGTGAVIDRAIASDCIVATRSMSQANSDNYAGVTDKAGALQSAIQQNSLVNITLKDNAVRYVFLTLPDPIAATFARPTRSLTALPATPTPLATPRMVAMPWGMVNLDPSIAETNHYAMSVWCSRGPDLIEPDRVSLWATNPIGMFVGRPVVRSAINVEALSKDSDWRTDANGEEFFDVHVVARNTPDQSDTLQFTLRIYYNASLAINTLVDERFGKFQSEKIFAPVNHTLTDINQIRIGQIYAIFDGRLPGGWLPEIRPNQITLVKPGGYPIGMYPIPVQWLGTCEYSKQQGWLK